MVGSATAAGTTSASTVRTERITQPLYKHHGQFVQIGWDDAFLLWAKAVKEALAQDASSVGTIGGGRLLNEEAYLLQHVFRAIGAKNVDWRAGVNVKRRPAQRAARSKRSRRPQQS